MRVSTDAETYGPFFVIVTIQVTTHPHTFTSTDAVPLRVFLCGFCEYRRWQTADTVRRAKRCRWDHVRAHAVCSLHSGELFFFVIIFSLARVVVLLLSCSQYVPHPTPHVALLASWRSISWSSNCDAHHLEVIHIIRCKSFVLSSGAVCIFSRRTDTAVGTSVSSIPQKC